MRGTEGLERLLEFEKRSGALLAKAGVLGPPVPIDEVARAAGISSITVAPISGDAMLVDVAGALGIVLNQHKPEIRRRFSIAHELGHLVLEVTSAHEPGLLARRAELKDAERAIDEFAAALLMPSAWIAAAAKDPTTVAEIARRFAVSRETMRIRLRALGYHQLARL